MEPNFIGRTLILGDTGLYVNYTSFIPWTHGTTWISSLVTRALKICPIKKLSRELNLIKKFAYWNDFPKCIFNSISRKILQAHQDQSEPNLRKTKGTCGNLFSLSILRR